MPSPTKFDVAYDATIFRPVYVVGITGFNRLPTDINGYQTISPRDDVVNF